MSEAPDPIDVHVGAAIRARRLLLGLSQEALSEACGVSFQQIQKYERGTNRVSASMLSRIAAALQAAPGAFFPDPAAGVAADALGPLFAFGGDRQGREILRLWPRLDEARREGVARVVAAVAATARDEEELRHVA